MQIAKEPFSPAEENVVNYIAFPEGLTFKLPILGRALTPAETNGLTKQLKNAYENRLTTPTGKTIPSPYPVPPLPRSQQIDHSE